MPEGLADDVAAVAAIAEPVRRALYRYVASGVGAVSREQAATAVDVPLHSAKFHLDRLVEAGLLEVEFRRLSGRTGPGAGRPSKLYRRSSRQIEVSLPERRYGLAGHILAAGIDRATRDGVPVAEAVREAAGAEGLRIASTLTDEVRSQEAAPGSRAAGDNDSGVARMRDVLARQGYEPRTAEHGIRLANCPFDRLVAEHEELVCSMSLAFIHGVIAGLGAATLSARLAPQPGSCCVAVTEHSESS